MFLFASVIDDPGIPGHQNIHISYEALPKKLMLLFQNMEDPELIKHSLSYHKEGSKSLHVLREEVYESLYQGKISSGNEISPDRIFDFSLHITSPMWDMRRWRSG